MIFNKTSEVFETSEVSPLPAWTRGELS